MYLTRILDLGVWKTVATVINPIGQFRSALTLEQKRRVVSIGKNIDIDKKIEAAQLWAIARESTDQELRKMQAAIKVVVEHKNKDL